MVLQMLITLFKSFALFGTPVMVVEGEGERA
jgi:hypothetical protein